MVPWIPCIDGFVREAHAVQDGAAKIFFAVARRLDSASTTVGPVDLENGAKYSAGAGRFYLEHVENRVHKIHSDFVEGLHLRD